jgi:hypothetical protein
MATLESRAPTSKGLLALGESTAVVQTSTSFKHLGKVGKKRREERKKKCSPPKLGWAVRLFIFLKPKSEPKPKPTYFASSPYQLHVDAYYAWTGPGLDLDLDQASILLSPTLFFGHSNTTTVYYYQPFFCHWRLFADVCCCLAAPCLVSLSLASVALH